MNEEFELWYENWDSDKEHDEIDGNTNAAITKNYHKAVFLAGQASKDQRIKELEEELRKEKENSKNEYEFMYRAWLVEKEKL